MDTKDFLQTWGDLNDERSVLIDRRSTLEAELLEIRNKISHLDEALNHLAPLADLSWNMDGDLSQLGITDAIRAVVRESAEKLSAQEVRRALIDKGYDLTGLTAPMSSIYKILSRLVEDSGEVERIKEGPKVFYSWNHHAPISDADIPF